MPKSGTLDPCEVPTQRNERIWSTDKKKRKEKSIRQNKMKQYIRHPRRPSRRHQSIGSGPQRNVICQ